MNKSTYHVFFSNLANPLRIEIISELKNHDLNVGEIIEKLNVEQSKVSHALAVLKSCNIVNSERKGKQIIYSLNKKTIVPILDLIEQHSKNYCKGKCKFCRCGK